MGSTLSQLSMPILFFFIALGIRAIFAFLETSLTAMRLFKLKELADSVGKYKKLFKTLETEPHRVLITTLIASSLADVTAASLGTYIMEVIFESLSLSGGLGFSVGIAFATIAIVIFGEIIPKNLAKGKSERLLTSMLWLINLVFYVLDPVANIILRFCNKLIYRITGSNAFEGSQWVTSEREISFLIDYIHQLGLMETEKTEMLQSIFELGRTPIKEIMVPTTDIISIEVNTPIKQVLDVFSKYHYTRLPVYENDWDNIIGMVHQKDIFVMLSQHEEKSLRELLRTIMFVPSTKKVNQLLREFRQNHQHMAIVLNEHGSILGLITLEDLIEEIVGDIADEHESASEKIIPLKQGGWLVDARMPLEELEELLNITFETEDAVTLAGFLTEKLQHLPKKGERILYKHYYFQVQKASTRRVRQVLVFEEKKSLEDSQKSD